MMQIWFLTVDELWHTLHSRREAKISELIKSYDVYEDLMAKTNRGVQFYGKLDAAVKRLLERTCAACKACEEERNKILERLAPKGKGLFPVVSFTF